MIRFNESFIMKKENNIQKIEQRNKLKKKYLNQLRGADDKTLYVFKEYFEQTENHIADLEWSNIQLTNELSRKIEFYTQRIRNYKLMLRTSKQYANFHAKIKKG